ncbi:MAG: glycoside hydrolase family 3 protein, partial [Microbacterium sp.]|nr:glycoside hydrolase family 3 protein [Microbacterium sp.]
ATSPDVQVYRSLTAGGPGIVMVSTAVYEKIDGSAPAAFSPTVVTQLLRGSLGYDGVVITDDLSAAASVAKWTPAQRATLAIDAGVDIVLVSSSPQQLPEMYAAVLAKAQADPAFAAKVDAAARRVVTAKLAGTD